MREAIVRPLFLRLHRLHAASEIDDGEAAMPQTDMAGRRKCRTHPDRGAP